MQTHGTLRACRVCLATSCRLYSISAMNLADIYRTLSVLPPSYTEHFQMPQAVCAVCVAQLRNAKQLQAKLMSAHDSLSNIAMELGKITVHDLKPTDDDSKVLKSVHLEPNHCNLHIIYGEQLEPLATIQEENPPGYLEENQEKIPEEKVEENQENIQEENQEYVQENIQDIIPEVNSEDTEEVNRGEHPEEYPGENPQENEFVAVDGRSDYYSDSGDKSADENTDSDDSDIYMPDDLMDAVHNDRTSDEHFRSLAEDTEKNYDDLTPSGHPRRVLVRDNSLQEINLPYSAPPFELVTGYNMERMKANFEVLKLNLDEQKMELEKLKGKANYLKSLYKCDTCYKGFKEEDIFNSHMIKHSEDGGLFECPVCLLHFHSRRNCVTHTRIHETMYLCKRCPFKTQHKSATMHHLEWHRGTVHKCNICSEVFNFETSLARHRRKRHPSPVSCVFCGRGCLDENGLRMHYQWKHAGQIAPVEGPRCDTCDLTFFNDIALTKHRRSQHAEIRTWSSSSQRRPRGNDEDNQSGIMFTCHDCDRSFDKRYKLSYHLRKKRCAASKVGMKQTREQTIKRMTQRKQCHVCGRLFQCAAHLRDHLDAHLDTTSYKCTDCGKTYKTLTRMKTHQRSHSSQFSCPICQKTFNWPRNMVRHCNNVHKTARDVACSFCSKGFKCKAERRAHELYTHLKKPRPTRIRDRKRVGSPIGVTVSMKTSKTT